MPSLSNSRSFVRAFLPPLAVVSLLGGAALARSTEPPSEQTGEPTEPATKRPPAISAYERGCKKGNAEDCYALAVAYYEGEEVDRDDAIVIAMFRKACALGHPRGCLNTGEVLFHGELGQSVDKTAAISFFKKACDGKQPRACFNLGGVYMNGEGAAEDPRKGTAYMKKACALEDADACEIVKELDSASASRGGQGANVQVNSMTVNGLTVKNLICRLDAGDGVFGAIMGPMVVIGVLAEKKAAFDECAPKGAAPRVTWSFSAGKVTKASVEAPTRAIKSCLEKALHLIAPLGGGECETTLVLGKTP